MPEVIPLEPTIITIFGISGDLSKRYLLPALFHLFKVGLLDSRTVIIGVSRQTISPEELLEGVDLHRGEQSDDQDEAAKQKLLSRIHMAKLDLDNIEDYRELKVQLDKIENDSGLCMNRLFYLSIPPKVYHSIIGFIGQSELNKSCIHNTKTSRLLIEKPFGYDIHSAQNLIQETSKVFQEDQLFRIDHYLAKETVQNILTFRFENPIFESIWNKDHIASIDIIASEQIGIMGRKVFYEPLGALRDFIQSHLIQLVAIVAMDQPEVMDSEHIHAEKLRLLNNLSPVDTATNDSIIRGQYRQYRDEVDNLESSTETFVAIRTTINNERWQNVPISIWTGKGLAEKRTEIIVKFKSKDSPSNRLIFRISPNEGIEVELMAKKPGYATELQPAHMNFSYNESFEEHKHPNAYERVLVDAIRGDHTLFSTSSEVIAAWRVVQPVLDKWSTQSNDDLMLYDIGMSGEELVKLFKS